MPPPRSKAAYSVRAATIAFSVAFPCLLYLLGWTVGGLLVAQLGGVIYLTYELGWDLMEPTTYLMGLAVTVASSGLYNLTKKDYEYGIHFERCVSLLFCLRASADARVQCPKLDASSRVPAPSR